MSDRRRRKSLSIFRPITPLTPIHDGQKADSPTLLKKRNPVPFQIAPQVSSPANSPTSSLSLSEFEPTSSKSATDRIISKTKLQKARPPSIFGSIRSFHSFNDEDEPLTRTTSTPLSLHSTHSGSGLGSGGMDAVGGAIMHHGEIQSTGGMFKRRNQYLVLTETHLVRFKSQNRASEMYPSIPASLAKANNPVRHSRMSSNGSLPELYAPSESYTTLRLNQIVAVHKLDDGRPYFSIEVSHLDEETNYPSAMVLQLNDPREADLWLSCIRAAAEKARLVDPLPFSQHTIEYTARLLEQERDYDPNQFHMFKVVQRATKSGNRSSSDDLAKLISNICILAIGVYKIHLVPIPKPTRTASSTSLADMIGTSHGIMTLTSLSVQTLDDKFELNFRIPLRQPSVLCLASSCVIDIALWIRQAADYLRPEWLEQPFTWNVPRSLDDELLPVSSGEEDHGCFDRTLTGYCAAYDIDTSRIRYSIHHQGEDTPAFQLLPPADRPSSGYSLLELLAVMRSLRYNESFTSISFANINLDVLHGKRDQQGWDHVPWTTRSGEPLSIPEQENSWLLIQEVRALALKSRKLRRLDFSSCLTRRIDGDTKRTESCGLCEALFPLCMKELTNVDWIVLNGVHVTEHDLDFLYAAAIENSCHFRAIELGGCGISDQGMHTVLEAMSHQGATMEHINLSGNSARFEPQILHETFKKFGHIRRIDLSCISRTSGPEPLLAAEILLTWKLENIELSRTPLNEHTLDALATYLQSPQSKALRSLHVNQCQLDGSNLASLLRAMDCGVEGPRVLHLFATENRLEQHHDELVNAIQQSMTPTHLTLQMLEYSDDYHFANLLQAVSDNRSLQYLDISRTSLPHDASDATSEALRRVFARNTTLEVLDLSGEEAHLEVATFGVGLNYALTGLKGNETLRVLRIERQKLGLQGANTLASVLENNTGLCEVYCDNNEINLQAFTVLVSSLEQNHTLQQLSLMSYDRMSSLRKVDRELDNLRDRSTLSIGKSTMRKTLGAAVGQPRSFSRRMQERSKAAAPLTSSDKEAKAAIGSLAQQWDYEVDRLQGYLRRNYKMAHGISLEDDAATEGPAGGFESTRSIDVVPRVDIEFDHRVDFPPPDQVLPDGSTGPKASSDGEDLFNINEDDDIEEALVMSRRLHI